MRYELAWITFMQGDYSSARRMYEEEVARMRQAGDDRRLANAYRALATVVSALGDYAEAARLFEETMRLNEAVARRGPKTVRNRNENLYRMGCTIHNIAENLYRMGDYAAARAAFLEADALYPTPFHKGGQAIFKVHLALPTYWLGERDAARALVRESLTTARQVGDRRALAEGLEGMAEMAAAEGQPERSVRLLGAAQSLRDTTGLHYRFMPQTRYDALLAALRPMLGDAAFVAAWETGRKLSWQQAVDGAVTE
jgi:tetratricopeptide (TPR) repeat protein